MDYTGYKFRWRGSNYIVLSTSTADQNYVVQCQLSMDPRPIVLTWAEFSSVVDNIW